MINTTDDATGPILTLANYRDTNGLSDGDSLGQVWFYGTDVAGQGELYVVCEGSVSESDHGDECAKFEIKLANDGTVRNGITMEADKSLSSAVDVTIGNVAASTTTIAGKLDVTGVADFAAGITGGNVIHYRFMGYSTGDGSNYETAAPFTDAQSPWEHNDTSSSDGLTIPATSSTNISELIRGGGHVMPRVATLNKWIGTATYNGADDAFVGLFKWTPAHNSSTDISGAAGTLLLLKATTITGTASGGNDVTQNFAETSGFAATVAAGDIIFTQIKTENSAKSVYFNSTLEVIF